MSREWIALSERKPTEADAINSNVIFSNHKEIYTARFDNAWALHNTTHWLPIPPLPQKPKVWRTATSEDVENVCRYRDYETSEWRHGVLLAVVSDTHAATYGIMHRFYVGIPDRITACTYRFCEVEADA